MRPSPAELVRTLMAGRLPALAHVAHRPGPHHVRHVTDPDGQLLMLVPVVSDLSAALEPVAGDDVAVVLDVLDLPPVAGAPSLGRAWVSGWATRLRDDAQRQATLDFADTAPTGDLLDVGTRFRLYRFEVAEARLERADTVLRVDPEEYAAAEPDPLHPVEAQVLADLADHHGAEVTGYVRRQLGDAAPAGPVRPVRVDRYGLVVAYGPVPERHQLRLAFPHPVDHPGELARALHPVLCRARATRTPD
ncbi:DUF2470 domain-containing protein [Micromonospora fluostatini]